MIKIPWSNTNTQRTTVVVQFLLAVGLQLIHMFFFLTSTLSFSLQDFEVFRSIDPREYIYELWNFGPKLTENLRKFSEVWRRYYLAAKLEQNTLNCCFGYSFWTSFERAFLSLQIVNKEMFWVVTEICSETNLVKRMKLIKAFIKIASE